MQAAQTPDSGARNALGGEPSAYLRQHAGNPVHWQPFGDQAFADAAARDVPVFLSIGYAACHWCHVMAHESFEDPAVADYLNEHFVAVKVDREERPDVDSVYMAATQAISGEGGWPMSVFLTPEGLAFYAGTYYPPRPLPGRPSFLQVLEAVHDAWAARRDAVEQNARALAQNMGQARLSAAVRLDRPPGLLDPELLPAAVRSLSLAEDPGAGGFGAAPKFPPSAVLEFLIRHAAVPSETAGEARAMAGRALAGMARSALFDQLDGGFARYSVTRDWSVPHFEKMLYDNAQLLRVYVHWVRSGGTEGFPAEEAADVARRTAGWMLASLGLGSKAEALASSLDADSVINGVHHEGGTYLWTVPALADVVGGDDAAAVARIMNVGEESAVSELGSPLHPAKVLAPDEAALWARVRPRLLAARNARPQPARDDKVVAGWNGLAVAALAEAGAMLDEPGLVDAAVRIGWYLEQVHWKPGAGRLVRVSHAGTARGIGGLLEDYAYCAEGFLALFSVTGDAHWYLLAESLITAACSQFIIDGGLADTAGESLPVTNAQGGRPGLEPFDGATPSGAAVFAGALLSYAALSGSAGHRALAGNILSLLPPIATRAPRAVGWLLAIAQAAAEGPVEAAVVGPSGPARDTLHRALLQSPSPGLVIAVGDEPAAGDGDRETGAGRAAGGARAALESDAAGAGAATADAGTVPLLRGRAGGAGGVPLVYLCRDMVCDRPVGSLPEVLERLNAESGRS